MKVLFFLLFFFMSGGVMAQDTPLVTKTAIFAGGCFWCMQGPFEQLEGVLETRSGYTGGHVKNPTYEQVSEGNTGHREAIIVVYDPAKTTYSELLEIYWYQVDPTDAGGQFCDRGEQYTTAVYYNDDVEKKIAQDSKMLLEADNTRLGGKPIVTPILKADVFYDAEDYHQGYYKKNPIRYKFYRDRCGRDERLEKVWGTTAKPH
jgi:peptide-methionine (S)-S-oxide reductase